MQDARGKINSFRDLEVYQRAYKFTLKIHLLTKKLPKEEQYSLGDQMRRAIRSVIANIAEGYGKSIASVAEFKRFLVMAYASVEEMHVWLNLSKDLQYISEDEFLECEQECYELSKMIYALRKNWR